MTSISVSKEATLFVATTQPWILCESAQVAVTESHSVDALQQIFYEREIQNQGLLRVGFF
jgi:hypothetical protein